MEAGCLVRALFDYEGTSDAELRFSFGDVFSFVEMNPRGWAKGEKDGVRGWFPVSFVEKVESEPLVHSRSRGMTVCAPTFTTPDTPCEDLFGTYEVEYEAGDDGYGDGSYGEEEEYEEEEEELYDQMEDFQSSVEGDSHLVEPLDQSYTVQQSLVVTEAAPPPPTNQYVDDSDLPTLEEVPIPPKKPVMSSSLGADVLRAARPQPRVPARHVSASVVSDFERRDMIVGALPEPVPPPKPFRHSITAPSCPIEVPSDRTRSGSNPQENQAFSPLACVVPNPRHSSPLVAKRLAACFGTPPVDEHSTVVELYDKEREEAFKPQSEDCDSSSILEKKEETTVNLNFFLQNRVNIHSDAFMVQDRKKSRLLRLLGKKDKRTIFGVPLGELKRDAADVCSVPYVVIQCCQYLEQKGLSTKGLFRVPGNQDRMQKLKSEFKSPTDLVDQSRFPDPHTVASVLKAFFQQLPEPLIPFEFFEEMLDISENEKKTKKKIQKFQETIRKLPASHNIVLIYLLKFLHNVSLGSKVNQMHARNLGIVWGPTLLRPATKDPIVLMSCNTKCTDVVECWIECYYKIFEPNTKRKK